VADVAAEAQELLDGVKAFLAHPPRHTYLADGRPAFDQCEQLTVHLLGVQMGTPPVERPGMPCAPDSVLIVVTRTWCIPIADSQGNPPPLTKLQTSGERVIRESWELWRAVREVAPTLACRPSILGAQPVEPSGGYVGLEVTLSWVPTG
jgi:hypothetical protein